MGNIFSCTKKKRKDVRSEKENGQKNPTLPVKSPISNVSVEEQFTPKHTSLQFSQVSSPDLQITDYSADSNNKNKLDDWLNSDKSDTNLKSQTLMLSPRITSIFLRDKNKSLLFLKTPSTGSLKLKEDEMSSLLHNSDSAQNLTYSDELYQSIFRNVLLHYYPISNEILDKMYQLNCLMQHDYDFLKELTSNFDKTQRFIECFVFTEINLCKLADFLNYLIENKCFQLFESFHQPIHYFTSLVDCIYFVVNLVGLVNSENIEIDFIASTVSLQKFQQQISISINFNNRIFPRSFWTGFSEINQSFDCCTDLILSNCNLLYSDFFEIIKGFEDHDNLTKLDLSSNPIGDSSVELLANLFLSHKSNIEILNLACCSLTGLGLGKFIEILYRANPVYCSLKELNVSHNDLNEIDEQYLIKLHEFKQMTKLEFQSTNIIEKSKFFESLKINYSIKALDLSKNKLSSSEVKFLASGIAYNFHIKILNLAMIGVSKSDWSTINNALLMNKSIVYLDLSDNHLGDDGLSVLMDLLTMKRTLKELYFRRCNISLHGLLDILRKASDTSCKLRLLDLCYNHSPRLSLGYDLLMVKQKIRDILSDISLMKDLKILLYGTIDLPQIQMSPIRERF